MLVLKHKKKKRKKRRSLVCGGHKQNSFFSVGHKQNSLVSAGHKKNSLVSGGHKKNSLVSSGQTQTPSSFAAALSPTEAPVMVFLGPCREHKHLGADCRSETRLP